MAGQRKRKGGRRKSFIELCQMMIDDPRRCVDDMQRSLNESLPPGERIKLTPADKKRIARVMEASGEIGMNGLKIWDAVRAGPVKPPARRSKRKKSRLS